MWLIKTKISTSSRAVVIGKTVPSLGFMQNNTNEMYAP